MNSPFVLDQIKAKDGSYLAGFLKQDLTEESRFRGCSALSDAESDAMSSPGESRSSSAVWRMGRSAVVAGEQGRVRSQL